MKKISILLLFCFGLKISIAQSQLAPVYSGTGFFYIDKKGYLPWNIEASKGFPFSDNLARIKKGKWGYINAKGIQVIEPKFGNAEDFHEGLARARLEKTGEWGYIDSAANWVIQPGFEDAENFSEGFAAVRKNKKWGFVDKQGKLIIDHTFDIAHSFQEGLVSVRQNEEWFFINSIDRQVVHLPEEYDYAYDFHNGLARIRFETGNDYTQARWRFIDKNGVVLQTPLYFHVTDFSEGFAAIYDGNYWSYIDSSGHVKIKLPLEDAGIFCAGLARVKEKGQWGYINLNGAYAHTA